MKIMKININEREEPIAGNFLESERSGVSESPKEVNHSLTIKVVSSKEESVKKETEMTKLQKRAKACTFYDPLINKSNPVLCGAENFVSMILIFVRWKV